MGILGELNRAGLIHNDLPTVHSASLKEALEKWDVMVTHDEKVNEFYKAGPAGIPTQTAFSQSTRWPSVDADRATGCIRSIENAYSEEGGLAILTGNLAPDGCVVKQPVSMNPVIFLKDLHLLQKAKKKRWMRYLMDL